MPRSAASFIHRVPALVVALLVFVALAGVRGNAQIANSPFRIFCGDIHIGDVTFDLYQDDSDADVFSVLVQGGFDPNGNCQLEPNHGYRWLQTVNTTAPIYAWQNANTTYMDRTRVQQDPRQLVADESPFYVNLRGPGYGHGLGFQDAPARLRTVDQPFTGTWVLYLVCADLTNGDISNANQNPAIQGTREIDVIAAFTWGFTVRNNMVTPTMPITMQTGAAFTAAFNALNMAFMNDPDADTFRNSWTLSQDCCCVPEPGAIPLLAAAGVPAALIVVQRMRKRRRAV